MDNETYFLSEKVYGLTKWVSKPWLKGFPEINEEGLEPYYSADYLLDKLPTPLNLYGEPHQLVLRKGAQDDYFAEYWHSDELSGDYYETGDTPIKALLKLTISLYEAGELR